MSSTFTVWTLLYISSSSRLCPISLSFSFINLRERYELLWLFDLDDLGLLLDGFLKALFDKFIVKASREALFLSYPFLTLLGGEIEASTSSIPT